MSEWGAIALTAPLFVAGVMVVGSRDIVRGILWLGAVLGWTAVLYAALLARFVAAIQLLLYAGGVVTLMIVGVMVTRRSAGLARDDRRGRLNPRALLTALACFSVMAAALVRTEWAMAPEVLAPAGAAPAAQRIGEALLGEHMVAFELLSLLLLAGMLGAIALVRRVPAAGGAALASTSARASARTLASTDAAPARRPEHRSPP